MFVNKILHFLLLFFLLMLCSCTNQNLYKHVKYLASDELEGRLPGSSGDYLAAEYIKDEFVSAGLDLLGNKGFQNFEFISGVRLGDANKLKFNNFQYSVENDFVPLSFSENAVISGDIFFGGYGFNIKSDTLIWNDYAGFDISDKWVMILRGSPDDNPHGSYAEHSSLITKALTAKDNSALGVIFVSGQNFDSSDNLLDLSYTNSQKAIGIPVVHITRDLANILLKSSNKTINDLESSINDELYEFDNFSIIEELVIQTDVIYEMKETHNIIGILNGRNELLSNEYLVIGAHYDHIGYGGENSGSRRPYLNLIHNGADDNASGVSILIELAKKYTKLGSERNIVFVAFGAEEMGLLGSKYFVNSNLIPNDDIQIMINLDMVGRLNDSRTLSVNGVQTADGLEEILKNYLLNSDLNYVFSNEGYGPSDHTSFYLKDVPVLFFFTGSHTDYHTPEDDFTKLNYLGMQQIEDLIFSLINHFDGSEKLIFKKTDSGVQKRPSKFKVTLGIMPDYVFNDQKGLRIDVVIPNKTAANSGLLDGDIIVEIDSKPVGDIYEYMHRLSELSPGQTVAVVVVRNNVELTYSVTF